MGRDATVRQQYIENDGGVGEKAESNRQKAESRRQKAEGRDKEPGTRNQGPETRDKR